MDKKIQVNVTFSENNHSLIECSIDDLPVLFGSNMTETRVRQIVREELSKFAMNAASGIWKDSPTKDQKPEITEVPG